MLTAKAQDKDVFEGYSYGADMYLHQAVQPDGIDLLRQAHCSRYGSGSDGGGPKRYDL
ncbi:MAG: hypothetical protein R2688_01545 [Fimbriimonadaceae bacterium]